MKGSKMTRSMTISNHLKISLICCGCLCFRSAYQLAESWLVLLATGLIKIGVCNGNWHQYNVDLKAIRTRWVVVTRWPLAA